MKCRGLLLFVMLLLSVGMPALAQEEMSEPDLRIGALPVINVLPLYVALDGGYFDEAGVAVEIVEFVSGADAQAAAVAGEIDGFQADLVSALKVNANGGDVRVVRHVGILNLPFITIVAGRDSGIESIEDLAGRQIGLSLNTIIQYMTDTMLSSAGVDPEGVEYVNLPGIWDRYQRLVDGEIGAATLPDFHSRIALQNDGRELINDADVAYVPEALNISAEALAEKGEVVRAFLAAYEQAVETINAMAGDQGAYQAFLEANDRGSGQMLKFALTGGFTDLPVLTRARVPSGSEYAAVHDWALGRGVLTEAQAYADVVDGQFLPEVMMEDMAEAAEVAGEEAAPMMETQPVVGEPDLRIAARSSSNLLPLYVALDAGYFEEEGVVVELVEFMNMANLKAAVQDGEVDGLQTGSVTRILQLNAGASRVRAVREVEITNLPYLAIIVGPRSEIESVTELAGVPVSVMTDGYSEFMARQLLMGAGLSADQVEIAYIYPDEVGDLFDRFLEGGIEATLVDPVFSKVASLVGGRAILDSWSADYSGVQELIGFRADTLAEKGAAVRAFLRAYERAEEALSAMEGDTQAYLEFVGRMGIEQDEAVERYVSSGFIAVPIFAPPGLPSAEEFTAVQDWALERGVLEAALLYEDVVDGSFLPEVMAEE